MRGFSIRKSAAMAVLGLAAVVAPAVAVPQEAHAATACRDNDMPAEPADKGGRNAEAWWSQYGCDSWNFKVRFQAYDEIIWVMEAAAINPVVEVKVWNKKGTEVVDRDTLKGKREYHIGYPDGSGNVPEGRRVDIRMCVGAPYWECTAWARGRS